MADEITIQFIEDYRSFPQLWDQNNKLYTNKIKRNDALRALAVAYNMDIDGVKKKIKSLRSYFSKEHQKVNKKKSGAGTDDVYHSPWFAYKHLLFTANSLTPRETCDEETQDASAAEIHNEQSSVTSPSMNISEDEHEFTLPPIRKKRNIRESRRLDDKEEEAYSFMKKASEELTQKDEYTIYGQLIAHKMRNLSPYNRLIAQQRINNIFFDLEMVQMNGAIVTPNVSGVRRLHSDYRHCRGRRTH